MPFIDLKEEKKILWFTKSDEEFPKFSHLQIDFWTLIIEHSKIKFLHASSFHMCDKNI
jgi:hypothetical protein